MKKVNVRLSNKVHYFITFCLFGRVEANAAINYIVNVIL